MKSQKKKSFPRRVFLCLLAVLLAVCIAFGVYVSEDGVLNRKKYEADRTNLPQDTTETVIDGGCHAGFGSYGAQKGDGAPVISAEEQQQQTADALAAWMNLQ